VGDAKALNVRRRKIQESKIRINPYLHGEDMVKEVLIATIVLIIGYRPRGSLFSPSKQMKI